MILTPEKVIPAKVEVTHDEFNRICDFKLLLDNMINRMEFKGVEEIAGIHKSWLQSMADGAQNLIDLVKLLPEVI